VALKTILVNDNPAGNNALMVGPKNKSFADLEGKKWSSRSARPAPGRIC